MKKIIFLLTAVVMISLVSCKKDKEMAPSVPSTSTTQTSQKNAFCGDATTVAFIAGQNMTAGNVIVNNDATNLYVTFTTSNGWEMGQTHLYVGDCALVPVNKSGSPQIGLFPYKTTHSPRVTSYTYTIALAGLPECFCVAAHAEVVQVDPNGVILQSQTAWGQGSTIGGNSWAMKFNYCKQVCQAPVCYGNDETGWANGTRFTKVGNWATYTAYSGEAESLTLFAGQTMEAGTVTLSASDNGYVTITVTLNSDWALQDVAEPLKVQGYDVAPSGNPNPGLFTTYKGTSMTINVPQSNFYGIHLDLRKVISCS